MQAVGKKEFKAKNTFFFDRKSAIYLGLGWFFYMYNSSNFVQGECKCKFYFAEIQMLKIQSRSSVL